MNRYGKIEKKVSLFDDFQTILPTRTESLSFTYSGTGHTLMGRPM